MQTQDRPRYFQIMAAMASAFRQEADEALLEGYWMGLAGLTLAEFEQAAAKAMRSARFLPTVAELREFAGIDLELESRVERWQKRLQGHERRAAERAERDRLALLAPAKAPGLPRLQEAWKNIGRLPAPARPAEVEIEQKPRVFDEDYAAKVKASLTKLAESEAKP